MGNILCELEVLKVLAREAHRLCAGEAHGTTFQQIRHPLPEEVCFLVL